MTQAEQMQALPRFFADIAEPRRAQGRRHRLSTVLAIAAGAILCGMRGYRAMSDWANSLGPKARERFRCRRENGRYLVPSQYVIRDVLIRVDPCDLDRTWGKLLSLNVTAGTKKQTNPPVRSPMASPASRREKLTHKAFSPPIAAIGVLKTAATTSLIGTMMKIEASSALAMVRKTSRDCVDSPSESSNPEGFVVSHRRCANWHATYAWFSTTCE
jgi:hypothetical protein